jgi:ABC-2 type transport system permease protein
MGIAIRSLWHREIVRFLADRSRVTSSLGQPVLFWLLFAGALDSSFRPGGIGYGEYFFPGTLAMIVLFTAIFSTITVIEDRKEGFLQGVLVSPVHPAAIAAGKILGASTLALGNGVVFALLAPLAGVPIDPLGVLAAFAVLALLAFAVGGMGFSLAWAMDSTAGYHGVMMLLFMPMLLLSGAFFPADGAHPVMSVLMALDPLTYGVALLRYAFYGTGHEVTQSLPSPMLCLAVSVLFAAATFSLGTWLVLRRTARNAISA